MKIKKFIATSMPQALQQVREDLGDRAIILNSRQVGRNGNAGGRPQVEITAAVEEQVAAVIGHGLDDVAARQPASLNGLLGNPVAPGNGHNGDPRAIVDAPGVRGPDVRGPQIPETDLRPFARNGSNGKPNVRLSSALAAASQAGVTDELGEPILQQLRGLQKAVERLERTAPASLSLPAELKRIGERLRAVGVAENHITECLQQTFEKLDADSLDDRAAVVGSTTSQLASLMPERRDIRIGKKRKVIGFVGPSGSGKTTAAAKIAAGFAVKHKERREMGRIVLVSVDAKRVAAAEQLGAFAEMIGIPSEAVADESEVHELLRRHSQAHLILMDMAGCGPHEHARAENQRKLLQAAGAQEVQVVIDSLTSYEHMLDVVEWSEPFPGRRLLFTKVDEAVRVGGLLSAAAHSRVPTSYLSVGPSLPGQIKAADLAGLVSEVVGEAEGAQAAPRGEN